MRHFNWRYASVFAGIGVFASFVNDANAARFQLRETSADKIGYACAGSAAEEGNITAQFDNPATMTSVDKSGGAGSLVMVAPNLKYDVSNATLQTTTGGVSDRLRNGNDGDNATPTALVPAAYLMWAVNDSLRLGLGVTAPWGLQTDYNKNFSGAQKATRSKLESADVNPSFALKLNDKLSVGAGFSIQYVKVDLASALQRDNVEREVPELQMRGKSVGYGYNLGLLFKPWSHTRIGLSYRSAVRHKLKGHMNVADRGNAQFGTFANMLSVNPLAPPATQAALAFIPNLQRFAPDGTSIRAPLTLPETFTLSAQHDFNSKWTGRFDAQWTRWKQLSSLNVSVDWNPNYAAGAATAGLATLANSLQRLAATTISEPLPARNTWFFSLGASYQYSDQTKLKFGLAHDQNAQKESSVRLPDNNRIWFSCGLEQKFTENLTASLDYSFIKVMNTDVNINRDYSPINAGLNAAATATGGGLVVENTFGNETFQARAKSYVNLLGARVQYKF